MVLNVKDDDDDDNNISLQRDSASNKHRMNAEQSTMC